MKLGHWPNGGWTVTEWLAFVRARLHVAGPMLVMDASGTRPIPAHFMLIDSNEGAIANHAKGYPVDHISTGPLDPACEPMWEYRANGECSDDHKRVWSVYGMWDAGICPQQVNERRDRNYGPMLLASAEMDLRRNEHLG